MPSMPELCRNMVERGASDMHLTIGNPPLIRVRGDLTPLNDSVIGEDDIMALLYETMNPEQWDLCWQRHDYDYAYEVPDLARYRANVFFNQQGIAAVFRTIPTKILSLADLGMPKVMRDMCKTKRGLILITGPTGSGKSTTLAAMIDEINDTREANILTIEDPIEFVHKMKKCKITEGRAASHRRWSNLPRVRPKSRRAIWISASMSKGELRKTRPASSFNSMVASLKRAEAENKEMSRSMVNVAKMASMGKLAATVAHEINNPLGGILTYAKLISRQISAKPV